MYFYINSAIAVTDDSLHFRFFISTHGQLGSIIHPVQLEAELFRLFISRIAVIYFDKVVRVLNERKSSFIDKQSIEYGYLDIFTLRCS